MWIEKPCRMLWLAPWMKILALHTEMILMYCHFILAECSQFKPLNFHSTLAYLSQHLVAAAA